MQRNADMTDYLDMDYPDSLEQCVEKFWNDNPDLKKQILRDWYAGSLVRHDTNMAGFRAVRAWLHSDNQ